MTTWHTQDPRAFTSTHLDPRFYAARSVFPTSPARSVCGSTSSRSSGGRNRNTQACSYCRLRKIRCDGGVVCSNCTRTKRSCEYKDVSDEDNRASKERKAFLKAQKLATGFTGRSPRGLKESASCPLLLQGWQPKTAEVRSSSPVQSTYDASSSSRPYPSVLLSSPLALSTPLHPSPETAPPYMDLNSTYDGQHSPSSSYTPYFPPSSSTPNLSTMSSSSFSTPPASPLYPSQPRFDDIPSSSWIIPPNPTFQAPTNYSTTTPSMDLSTSPVEPSTFIPLPQTGLGVGSVFEEFELDATSASAFVPPLPFLPLAAEEPSFIPQIDFGALEPFMGEGWAFDAPWEGATLYEGEQAPQGSWVV